MRFWGALGVNPFPGSYACGGCGTSPASESFAFRDPRRGERRKCRGTFLERSPPSRGGGWIEVGRLWPTRRGHVYVYGWIGLRAAHRHPGLSFLALKPQLDPLVLRPLSCHGGSVSPGSIPDKAECSNDPAVVVGWHRRRVNK